MVPVTLVEMALARVRWRGWRRSWLYREDGVEGDGERGVTIAGDA